MGDAGTAGDLNTYIRDNTNWLYGDTAWQTPSFSNSWASTYNAGFRRFGNLLMLRGQIYGGTLGTTAFTLPAGYYPGSTIWVPAVYNGLPAQLLINGSAVVPSEAYSAGSPGTGGSGVTLVAVSGALPNYPTANPTFSLDGVVIPLV